MTFDIVQCYNQLTFGNDAPLRSIVYRLFNEFKHGRRWLTNLRKFIQNRASYQRTSKLCIIMQDRWNKGKPWEWLGRRYTWKLFALFAIAQILTHDTHVIGARQLSVGKGNIVVQYLRGSWSLNMFIWRRIVWIFRARST